MTKASASICIIGVTAVITVAIPVDIDEITVASAVPKAVITGANVEIEEITVAIAVPTEVTTVPIPLNKAVQPSL